MDVVALSLSKGDEELSEQYTVWILYSHQLGNTSGVVDRGRVICDLHDSLLKRIVSEYT